MENQENNVIELDNAKLKRMQFKIYALERENMRNNEKTDSQMIEAIKKIIETEAKKCY